MTLNERPKSVIRPDMHFVYVEKLGPFMKTAPKAWGELSQSLPALQEQNKITGKLSLFKTEPKKHILQAGVSLASKPAKLPKGMKYAKVRGGRYARFILTGPYSDLPMAWARVFDLVVEKKLKVRPSFCIESYVNDSVDTSDDQLVTEILVPTRAARR
jgi:effector-binding domain-containing protein